MTGERVNGGGWIRSAVLGGLLFCGAGLERSHAQATLPFFDGFESGVLSDSWTTHIAGTNGRIRVATNGVPYNGSHHVVLDSISYDTAASLDELVLTADLTGQSQVHFNCWVRRYHGGIQAMPAQFVGSTNVDGIALSQDGTNWHRLAELTNMPVSSFSNIVVDLDEFAAERELSLDGLVQIKFQQYGYWPLSLDGLSFDDVQLYAGDAQADLTLALDGVANLVAVGSNLAYTILVSNAGPASAENVVLTNRWTFPATVVSADASQGTWTTNADFLVAEMGTLAAGATGTVTVIIQPLATGVITNHAAVSSTTLDIHTVDNRQSATTQVEWAGGDLFLGAAATALDEDQGWADLTLFRTGSLAGVVSIDYEILAGTAEAGSDYEAVAGTLFLSNGVADIQVSIPILNDEVAEETEFFTVRLSNPGGGAVLVAPSNVTIHIRDEDGVATLPYAETFESGVFSNHWATYASLSTRPAIATNDGPHGGVRHVDMRGDAWSNALSELVLSVDLEGREDVHLRFWHKRHMSETERPMPAWFAGHTNADGVAISADGTNWFKIHGLEDAETGEGSYRKFDVALDPILASHGLEYTSRMRIKFQKYGFHIPEEYGRFFDDIALDVPAGNLRFAEPWTWEVAEGGGAITLAVERVDGDVGEVRVEYATYDGTAGAGSEYVATAGTLVFPDGVLRQEIVVPILQDAIDEDPREWFTVLLFHPQGGASLASPMLAEVAVIDDDGFGELEFSAAHFTVMETAAVAEVSVLRRYGLAGTGTVRWRTQAVSAAPAGDYVETTGTLTFATGAVQQVCEIPLLNDVDTEGPETIQLILYEPEGDVMLGSVTTAVLTIQDDEGPRAAFPFYEGFESGAWSNHWTVASTGSGRIQLANPTNGFEGNRCLAMDSAAGAALNEATLTVDLAGQSSVVFRCWTRDYADVAHPMPATFTGTTNADGIAVSADGLVWHRLVDLAALGRRGVYTNLEVDLAAFAAERGLSLTGLFQIRFQQYDTGAFPARGRSFDHISLTPAPSGTSTVIRAQGFEGGVSDGWGFKLMPMDGQIAVRSERKASGSRSLRLAGSDKQSDGPFVEFDNVVYGALENVRFSVAFSASGPDNSDDLYLDLSYDNGLTWTNAAKLVDGFGDANVPFGGTSASNPATVGANPWTVDLPASESQVKVRLYYEEAVYSNNTNDFYFVDDVVLSYVPSNRPPVLEPLEQVSVWVGDRVEFTVAATDVDSDPIALAVSNLPAGATFVSTNGNGVFVWESATPAGVYDLIFTAADKDGTTEEPMAITVNEPVPELPAPVIQAATDVQEQQFTANWLASAGATGYRLDVCTNAAFPDTGRGGNLLANAGFETGDSTGWDAFETEYAVVTNAPQEGEFHATCTATGVRGLMQSVDIIGDGVTAYEVSFHYKKPDAAGNARIWSTWTAGGQASGDNLHPSLYLPAVSNWTQATYSVVPESGSNTLSFEVRTYSGATVEWDNFFVGIEGDATLYPPGYEGRAVDGATACVVTGLTGGATYFYRVQATNAATTSPFSAVTSVVTEAAIPAPPELEPIGDKSVAVGDLLDFGVRAMPTGGDPVTLTASNLPSGALLVATNENGWFLWLATAPTGTYSVTFYATDKDGTDEETISITVHPGTLLAPVVLAASGVQATQFNANWRASSNATGYRLDVGTNRTFTGDGGGSDWVTNGYHNGNLGQGTGGTWSEAGLTQGSAGAPAAYLISLVGDSLTTPLMDFSSGIERTLAFKARTYGGVNPANNTLTVSISTNGGSSWSLLGTRVPTNATLTAQASFDLAAYASDQVRIKWETLGATATVGAGIDEVLITYKTGYIPPWFLPGYEARDIGNATTFTVTGVTASAVYFYRVMAYHGSSNSPYSAVTSVVTTASAGTPPVLGAIGGQSVFLGATLQFQVVATPTESDAVTLTASNLPAGAVFYPTNETGTFVWSGAAPTGEYIVVFYATDKDGSDGEAVGVNVHPVPQVGGFAMSNGAPALASISSVAGREYRMEYCPDLMAEPLQWFAADSEMGTGGNITLQDTNTLIDTKRYYRIVLP